MKKPNLTGGNWYLEETGFGFDLMTDIEDITVPDILAHDIEENNAKAMAQAPNLIDELIDVYYVLRAQVDSWGERRKHHDLYANMKSIEKTLLDAGCSHE